MSGGLDKRALRQTLGQFATGVTVVTCRAPDGTPVGMTANSFTSVSLEPPLVLWSVDRTARSFEAFAGAQDFAFSVLAQDQAAISNRFSKPGVAKFAGGGWSPGRADVPLIDEAAAHIECVQHTAFAGGDHLIIVGEVVRFKRSARRPLVFAQGRYGVVAPDPGGMASD
ncbi:MAG: flavin reductase family protein, partial [Pseudomonadota bacterium]